MAEPSAFTFTIQRAKQQPVQIVVAASKVLLGSAAHCEVRLDDADAAPEQLLFESTDGVVVARTRSRQHGVLVDGLPFSDGPIAPTDVVSLGQTTITVRRNSESETQERRGQRATKLRTLVVYAMGAVVIPFGGYSVLRSANDTAVARKPIEPPALFATAAARCPQSVESEASAVAESEVLLADAKRERAPFHPEDGVRAVSHYETAAACYRVAGNADGANTSQANADALKKMTMGEFHIHRARLDYALTSKRYDRARGEVQALLSFLGSEPSEYRTLLKRIDLQIQREHATKPGSAP